MIETDYRFTIEYYDDGAHHRASVPVRPDWEPAARWTHFTGIRRGQLEPVCNLPSARIAPVWDRDRGAPAIGAVRVAIDGRTGAVTGEIPRAYFHSYAEASRLQLVARGALAETEKIAYRVCAYRVASSPAPTAGGHGDVGLEIEDTDNALPILEREVATLLARAMPCGPATVIEEARALIPQRVTQQILEICERTRTVETGGALVGNLCRDPDLGDVHVLVTAQIPALHTEARTDRLTFTAETWSAVHRAIDLRGRGEIQLGWWHFHPHFCHRCPLQARRRCAMSKDFFSSEDIVLHRTCFPGAHQLAMLVSDHGPDGVSVSMYGWRAGLVAERGFDVFDADRAPSRTQPTWPSTHGRLAREARS